MADNESLWLSYSEAHEEILTVRLLRNKIKGMNQGFVKGEDLFSFCYLTSSYSFNLQTKN